MNVTTNNDMLLGPLITAQSLHIGDYPHSAIATVKRLIDKIGPEDKTRCPIFCELMQLSNSNDDETPNYRWLERARWIKYEETVEGGGKRWSKPHVTLLSLTTLLQIRNCFKEGLTILDWEDACLSFEEFADLLILRWIESSGVIDDDVAEAVFAVMNAPKLHLNKAEYRDRTSSSGAYSNTEEPSPTGPEAGKDRKRRGSAADALELGVNGVGRRTSDTNLRFRRCSNESLPEPRDNQPKNDTRHVRLQITESSAGNSLEDLTPTDPKQNGGLKVDGDLNRVLSKSDQNVNQLLVPLSPTSRNFSERKLTESRIDDRRLLLTTASKFLSVGRSQGGIIRKMKDNSESANIFIGHVKDLSDPAFAFVRLKDAVSFSDVPEVPIPSRFVVVILVPYEFDDDSLMNLGKGLGTLMVDEVFAKVAYYATEASELFQCVEEFLSQAVIVPPGKWIQEFHWEPSERAALIYRGVGRTEIRSAKVSHASSVPPSSSATAVASAASGAVHHAAVHINVGLQKSAHIFGGLAADIKRKAYWFVSDFVDAFRVDALGQTLAVTLFLFFANFTKVISFGGIMEVMLGSEMATIETILAAAVSGVLYALFAGQPLSILTMAGPVLVFEAALYHICMEYGIKFLVLRFWMGFWTAVLLLLIVAFDLSILSNWITLFTEDIFATIVSLIFISSACVEVLHIAQHHPITTDIKPILDDPCICRLLANATSQTSMLHRSDPSSGLSNTEVDAHSMFVGANSTIVNNVTSKERPLFWSGQFVIRGVICTLLECLAMGGEAHGLQCHFLPDVFLFSLILFVSTFIIAINLKHLKNTGYFPARVRNTLAEFGVVIAIVSMTVVSYFVGLEVPGLHVPSAIVPTLPRSWFINPFDGEWWVAFAGLAPAILFTILVVMDQHITAVILNRRENKLKKSYGYHLDLAILAIIFVLCGLMGIPYFVAGTVVAIMHVESLKIMSDRTAPGERPQFLGIREQRVTALLSHLLIGLSVFLTPLLRLIPLPVLLGIVLYMGAASLSQQQFVQRLLILLIPVKYQPDYKFLQLVPLRRVHLFTALQFIIFAALLVVEYTPAISIAFPIMLIVLIAYRKLIVAKVFSLHEINALDNVMPTWREIMKPRPPHFEGGKSMIRRNSVLTSSHSAPTFTRQFSQVSRRSKRDSSRIGLSDENSRQNSLMQTLLIKIDDADDGQKK